MRNSTRRTVFCLYVSEKNRVKKANISIQFVYFLFRISEAWVRNPATQVNNELLLYLHFKLRADGRKITVGTNSQIMPDYMPALKENRQS